MSWAEIKKAINSNISKSLDVLITEKSNEIIDKILTSKIDSTEKIINLFSDSTYMNSVVQLESKCKAIIADDVLYNILMSNSKSYSIFVNSYIAMKALTGSKTRFSDLVETGHFLDLLSYSSFRNAMFDNASITEQIIRNSSRAISQMKSYSYETYNANGNNNGNLNKVYDGKGFGFDVNHDYSVSSCTMHIGNCVIGDNITTVTGDYTQWVPFNKFLNPVYIGIDASLAMSVHVCIL